MPKKRATIWNEAAFEVKPSTIPDAGLGLFALERIRAGDTIGYYSGEIITSDEMDSGRYSGSEYILWVARNHVIVGEGPKANYTRYINHSDDPNAFLVVSTRWKTARFEALKAIHPGEEIFFHYGDDYWEQPPG